MNTLFIGHELIELERTASTNTFAINLIKQKPVHEGVVIWAKEQTEGRGQRGNQWHSLANCNLTFSVIIKPTLLPLALQFELNKICSLAVSDALRQLLPAHFSSSVHIKWPNDIYVSDKKIAGILIETVIRSTIITHAVIGIGFNVNQTAFSPQAGNPTSLKLLTNSDYDLKNLLYQLCKCMEARYLQLTAHKQELINNNYTTLLYRLNAWHYFRYNNTILKGMITGVNPVGLLNIAFEDGKSHQFTFQEVGYVS